MGVDVLAQQWQTIRIVAQLTTDGTTPIPLSGAAHPQGWLAVGAGGATVAGVATISDAAAGEITLLFTDVSVLALEPARYPWVFWLQMPTGDRLPVLEGVITIKPGTKQPTWT